MAGMKVFYDRDGHTLTVWFAERPAEYVCEETGDEVVLMKDASGGSFAIGQVAPGPEATVRLGPVAPK